MEKKKKKYVKPEVVRIPVDFKQLVRNATGGGGGGGDRCIPLCREFECVCMTGLFVE